ncbi:hypothetical protein CC80DRAFT_237685 [Byssothecium circinans]|uniref:Uncharacterized protein n=1 Tax=Byssothecium circinans TaxID=147558 RepID=A0A6A5U9S2_9PLEO|nr:hypothetical protein CC80DRAFT_237685 [Byssothecium circinans]
MGLSICFFLYGNVCFATLSISGIPLTRGFPIVSVVQARQSVEQASESEDSPQCIVRFGLKRPLGRGDQPGGKTSKESWPEGAFLRLITYCPPSPIRIFISCIWGLRRVHADLAFTSQPEQPQNDWLVLVFVAEGPDGLHSVLSRPLGSRMRHELNLVYQRIR